eukprot:COSAG06_NODE_48723_length_330_cov_0.666667_1_plen_31_part_10
MLRRLLQGWQHPVLLAPVPWIVNCRLAVAKI